MKKLLPFLMLLSIIYSSCDKKKVKSTNDSDSLSSSALSSSALMVDSAKTFLDSANYYASKAITNEITDEEARVKINPAMDKFFEIYKKLSPDDSLAVYNYRKAEVNKLIELQIEQQQK